MRKNKIIMLVLCMMLLCNFILFNDVAKAVSVFSLDYGWELIPSGDSDNETGLINFTRTCAGCFETSGVNPHSGYNSFYVGTQCVQDDDIGYWNLTTEFNYISNMSFWCYFNEDSATEDLRLMFFDDDEEVLNALSPRFSSFCRRNTQS